MGNQVKPSRKAKQSILSHPHDDPMEEQNKIPKEPQNKTKKKSHNPTKEPQKKSLITSFEVDYDSPDIWCIPEDVLWHILDLLNPKVLLGIQTVSKLWFRNTQHQKYWEYHSKKEGIWYPYETKPTDWLAYYLFCCKKQKVWPFTKLDPSKSTQILLHPPTNLKVSMKRVNNGFVRPPSPIYRSRVYGMYRWNKVRYICQGIVEGFPISMISKDDLKEQSNLETLCYALLEPNTFSYLDPPLKYPNSYIITNSGIPCFYKAANEIYESLSDSGGTGTESFYTGTYSGTGSSSENIVPKSIIKNYFHSQTILNLVTTLNGINTYVFTQSLAEQFDGENEIDKRAILLDYYKKAFPNYTESFHRFLLNAFDLEYTQLNKELVDNLRPMLKMADPSFKILKKLVNGLKSEQITLGPKSGVANLLSSALFDKDFVEPMMDVSQHVDSPFQCPYIPQFLEGKECEYLLSQIEKGTWTQDKELKRVQIFGYNYLHSNIAPIPIPEYFYPLLKKIQYAGFGTYDQLIISEFMPGIGIVPHVDRFFWDESIIGISLISSCVMEFRKVDCPTDVIPIHLEPGSLYQLKGVGRYEYTHGIPAKSIKERRISLTFRNLTNKKISLPETIYKSLKVLNN